jgi:hypothetical protein
MSTSKTGARVLGLDKRKISSLMTTVATPDVRLKLGSE